jgi:hypothetical protein
VSDKCYFDIEEEEMEEVRQLNRVPSKGKRFALVKTKWYAPYVIRGTKWLIKGNILEYEGK